MWMVFFSQLAEARAELVSVKGAVRLAAASLAEASVGQSTSTRFYRNIRIVNWAKNKQVNRELCLDADAAATAHAALPTTASLTTQRCLIQAHAQQVCAASVKLCA
jgi:hypothetical protein